MLKQNTPSEIAYRVVERLTQAGHESYWAGGCVRDRLLGRTRKIMMWLLRLHPIRLKRSLIKRSRLEKRLA